MINDEDIIIKKLNFELCINRQNYDAKFQKQQNILIYHQFEKILNNLESKFNLNGNIIHINVPLNIEITMNNGNFVEELSHVLLSEIEKQIKIQLNSTSNTIFTKEEFYRTIFLDYITDYHLNYNNISDLSPDNIYNFLLNTSHDEIKNIWYLTTHKYEISQKIYSILNENNINKTLQILYSNEYKNIYNFFKDSILLNEDIKNIQLTLLTNYAYLQNFSFSQIINHIVNSRNIKLPLNHGNNVKNIFFKYLQIHDQQFQKSCHNTSEYETFIPNQKYLKKIENIEKKKK